eukprot:10829982-Karenia_brevis.AAC.1
MSVTATLSAVAVDTDIDETLPTKNRDDSRRTHNQSSLDSESDDEETLALKRSSNELCDAVHNLISRQSNWVNEEAGVSFDTLVQLFSANPLFTVQPNLESGNVMILFDCNTFGVTDVQACKRVCPVGKDKIDIPVRALLKARQGTDEPAKLTVGDIYTCFDGGKDRKRLFVKPLKNPNMKSGRDRNRTFMRTLLMHVSEASWRARRQRFKGNAKLTQQVYMVGNIATFNSIKHVKFSEMSGSTKSDVCGTELEPLEDIPKIKASKVKDYYGKRWIMAGGKPDSESDSNSGDAESNDDDTTTPLKEREPKAKDKDTASSAKDPLVPIAPHVLPTLVVTDLAKSFNVKHIIDLAPTPHSLAFEVIRRG